MATGDFVKTADAVVIGGGSTGVSTLYHLARRGIKAVLVERTFLAAGGTGRSTAILRQHYAEETLVRMARRSLEIFQQFSEIVGGDPAYVRTGYLMLVPPEHREVLASNVALQQRAGVRTQLVSPEDLRALHPGLRIDDVGGAAYEPDGGYVDPVATTQAYAARARELGARILVETEVVGISARGGKVAGVRTGKGEIATSMVLNAAGLWAPAVARMAGLEIPVRLGRHLVVILERPPELHGLYPICADRINLAGFRPEGETLLLVGSNEPIYTSTSIEPDNFDVSVDFETILDASIKASRRFTGMERAVARRSYAALFDISPDWNFIIDETPELRGFFVASGFSGHGFKHCPVLGELLATFMIERQVPEELRPFTLTRFSATASQEPRSVYRGLPMV